MSMMLDRSLLLLLFANFRAAAFTGIQSFRAYYSRGGSHFANMSSCDLFRRFIYCQSSVGRINHSLVTAAAAARL